MKVLVVGAGSIGRRHIRNLRSLGCEEIVVCRSRTEGSAELEAEFGVRCVYDLEEALMEGVDGCVIANHTSMHVRTAITCVEHGCHLLIEKPLAASMDEVSALIELAREHRVRTVMGYNLRFHPLLQEARRRLGRGELGRVYSVRAWVGQYLPDWHPGEDYRQGYAARADLGGGAVLTLSHELDYLYWLFGPVARVTAMTAQPSPLELGVESVAEISLGFQSGMVGQVHLDYLQRTVRRGFEIIGETGTMQGDFVRSQLEICRPGQAEPEVIAAPVADRNEIYLREMAHFLDCARGLCESEIPLEDGAAVLKIALAALEAGRTGVTQVCP